MKLRHWLIYGTLLDHGDPKITPGSLKFQKNKHGKPEIQLQSSDDCHQTPLCFNISHSSSLIACGVTVNSEIGIDVEEKHRTIRHDVLSFARRYFSKLEVQFLSSISDPQVQQMEFMKLWTLKEAYVKALGKGFSAAPFKTFTIRYKGVMNGGYSLLEDPISKVSDIIVDSIDGTSNWQFVLLELDKSHYTAICTEKQVASEGDNENIPLKLTVWKTIPLLENEYVSGTDAVKVICGLQ